MLVSTIIQTNFINATVDVTSCKIKKRKSDFILYFQKKHCAYTYFDDSDLTVQKTKKYHNSSCLFVLNSRSYGNIGLHQWLSFYNT